MINDRKAKKIIIHPTLIRGRVLLFDETLSAEGFVDLVAVFRRAEREQEGIDCGVQRQREDNEPRVGVARELDVCECEYLQHDNRSPTG